MEGGKKKFFSNIGWLMGGKIVNMLLQFFVSLATAIENVVWKSRTNGYDNLVVPHHGSKMNYTPLKIKKTGTAVICCNNSKNRAAIEHKNALKGTSKQPGYHICLTELVQKYCIDLNLD